MQWLRKLALWKRNNISNLEINYSKNPDDRAWQLLEKVSLSALQEQRRSRRWGILFKCLTFVWIFSSVYLLSASNNKAQKVPEGQYTALVKLDGQIGEGGRNLVSAETVIKALRRAYRSPGTAAVILQISSPGGSPVHSGYIFDEIIRLREIHDTIPLYAVIGDMGASGGYYVAAAADEIYADKASLIGSIGVVSSGFEFTGLMDKLGITRRVHTAGQFKAFNDPFGPADPEAVFAWQQSLTTIHDQFIESVERGRGDRLQADSTELYTGMLWAGEKALELGLIDALGSSDYVAREVVGEPRIVDFSVRLNPLQQLAQDFGQTMTAELATMLGINTHYVY